MNKEEKKPKFWKRKIGIFGKQIPVVAVLLVLVGGLGGAVLMDYFGQIKTTVNIEQSIKLNGNAWNVPTEKNYGIQYNGWEQKKTDPNILSNDADKDLNVDVTSNGIEDEITVTHDSVGLSTERSTEVSASVDVSLSEGTVSLLAEKNSGSDASEARITILGSDVGVESLSDLYSFSWDVSNGLGYAPHLDVFLDLNGNGLWDGDDKVLVFEHAKVSDTGCDNINLYPTGGYNTFEDKGIVDGDAKAWTSPGLSGGCTTEAFVANWHTLNEWKTGEGVPFGISGTTKVLRFELEVDAWGQMWDGTTLASADISNIEVNGVEKEITTYSNPVLVEAESELVLYINSVFGTMLEPDTYTITTTVTLP